MCLVVSVCVQYNILLYFMNLVMFKVSCENHVLGDIVVHANELDLLAGQIGLGP